MNSIFAIPSSVDDDSSVPKLLRTSGLYFLVGAVVSGAIVGGLVASLGKLVLAARLERLTPLVGSLAMAYGVAEALGRPLPVPSSPWRVPRQWSALGNTAFSLLFGASLGVGVITAVSYLGIWVLLVYIVAAHNPWEGAAAMAFFGALRGIPVLKTTALIRHQSGSATQLRMHLVDAIGAADRTLVRRFRIVVLLIAGLALIAAALG
jgi:sulfite exporter TauE/SafE